MEPQNSTQKCFPDTKAPLVYLGKIQNCAKKVTYMFKAIWTGNWLGLFIPLTLLFPMGGMVA